MEDGKKENEHMREQISLNGTWQLKGTASYVPLRDKSMETGKPLEGVTGWMDAQVPGGVARALYQAGYIDHPYVDMNSLKCEWIETAGGFTAASSTAGISPHTTRSSCTSRVSIMPAWST